MDGRSLCTLVQHPHPVWRKYIDLEHATCYSEDNYWCGLTDGKMKYIWNLHDGSEQLFDLQKDPTELHNCVMESEYRSVLGEMRDALVVHLQERGDVFVKNGKLQTLSHTNEFINIKT